jgi:predicted dehydrogenase
VAPLRIGIVGVGNIATLNVPGYLAHDDCEVVALCDPRQDVLDRRGREWSVERCYTSIDDLLADDSVDAVEILSPTPLHGDHVLAALAAGKHVSCQKPIANSVATGRRMADAAREAGLVFRVTEQCCHYPPLEKARALIRSGDRQATVVRIKTVVGRTDSSFQAGSTLPVRVALQRRSPGGHLFDDVMHKYAMALWLVDEDIRSVQAVVRRGPLFFEAPTVRWGIRARRPARHDGGVVRPRYVHPQPRVRRRRVLRDPGDARVHLGHPHVRQPARPRAVVLYEEDGRRTTFADMDASYEGSFRRAAALRGLAPRRCRARTRPRDRRQALQLAFAVYQASNERRPVRRDAIDGAVSPVGWPPNGEDLRRDVEEMMAREQAYGATRVVTPGATPRVCARKLRQWSAGSEAAADHTGEAGRFLTCRGRP